jgi:hypothetical protein
MPRANAQHADFAITGSVTILPAYSDIPALVPGTPVTFSVWHKRVGVLDLDASAVGGAVREHTRSQTPNSVPTASITEDYVVRVAVGRAGGRVGRIVYAIQTFSGGHEHGDRVLG